MFSFISLALCGISLFLLGMSLLTRGLQSLASTRLKKRIKQRSPHPLLGMLMGTLITMVIQSSSGTTLLLVGLAEAKLLTLDGIAPMIMGANIGTTITAQLIAFNVAALAPFSLFLGVFTGLVWKRGRSLGDTIIGFSLIFIGIDLLSKGLSPLQEVLRFQEILLELGRKPFLGMLMGLFSTAIIQSSSTGVAILQSMAAGGSLTITSAVPILLGQNIGTCATTLLASLQLSTTGKRAALIHLLFNALGVMLIFPFINWLCRLAVFLSPNNPVRQIAHSHSLFNLISTIILLPFCPYLVRIARALARD